MIYNLRMPGKYDNSLFTLRPMIGHVQGTVKRSRNDVWNVVKTRNTSIRKAIKGLHINHFTDADSMGTKLLSSCLAVSSPLPSRFLAPLGHHVDVHTDSQDKGNHGYHKVEYN